MPVPHLPDELLALIAHFTEGKHVVANFRLVSRRFARLSHEIFMDRVIRTRGIICSWGRSLPDLLRLINHEVLGRQVRHIIICPILYTSKVEGYDQIVPLELLLDVFKTLALRKQEIRLSIVHRVNDAIASSTSHPVYKKLRLHRWGRDDDCFWRNAYEITYPCWTNEYYPKELSIDAGCRTNDAALFHNAQLADLASNLRALDLGVLYTFPRNVIRKRQLESIRRLLVDAPSVEKLSLRLGWTYDFSDYRKYGAVAQSHDCGYPEAVGALEALVGGVTMPHLVSLDLPKGLWYLRPLLDFICRHPDTLQSLRLINVNSRSLNPSDKSLQEAFDTLKARFPTLKVIVDNTTTIINHEFDLKYEPQAQYVPDYEWDDPDEDDLD